MAKDKFPLLRGGQDFLIPLEMMEQYRDLFSAQLSETELEEAIKKRKKEIRFEEERRLCYVAFTRAKEDLILSLSLEYGGKEREPSEFLTEIGYDHWRDLEIPVIREAKTNTESGANKEVKTNTGTSVDTEMEISFDALDLSYRRDLEIKTAGLVSDNELEREKNRCLQLLIEALDKDLEESVHYLMLYRALRDGGCKNYLEKIQQNWNLIDPAEKAEKIFSKMVTRRNGLRFNPEAFSFSFSALKVYEKCPKQYELQEILRMPSRKREDSRGALAKGSFVHEVLEIAVKEKVAEKQAFYKIAETLHKKPDWMYVNLESILPLFEVFWLRNKDRISNNLMVEQVVFGSSGRSLFSRERSTGLICLTLPQKRSKLSITKPENPMCPLKTAQNSSCFTQKALNICIRNTGLSDLHLICLRRKNRSVSNWTETENTMLLRAGQKVLIEEQSMLWSRLHEVFLMIMSMGLRRQGILKSVKSAGSGCIVMVLICDIFFSPCSVFDPFFNPPLTLRNYLLYSYMNRSTG